MVVKTVEVTDDQAAFLRKSTINFSKWVRKHIDDEMTKEEGYVVM